MRLNVPDMNCGGCARAVKAAILDIDAGATVEADPPSRTVTVQTAATAADIQKVLAEAGFPATLKQGQ